MNAKEQLLSIKRTGEEQYCRCVIKWEDDNTKENVVIKLNTNYDENDDMIFAYVACFNDLLILCNKNNGEDFYITDIDELY